MDIKILKILVGIDGSEYSFNAARYAIDVAKKYGSEILFLSVLPSKIHHGASSGIFGAIPPSYFNKYKKDAEKWFQEIIDMAKKEENLTDKQIKTDVITTSLSTAAAILNYAEEKHVDLIIIGNKGNSGIKKMLLGSVASDIVTYSYCPVMIIK